MTFEPALPLTRRQHDILGYYKKYVADNGFSPTLEEAAQHFGVNKVTIFGHVSELERKGALARAAKGVHRAVRIRSVPGESESPEDAGTARARVEILGSIAAGSPIEAVEDPEVFDLGDLVPDGRDVYALRVRGHSMIDDGIRDGDIVLVEKRSNARNGELVVAVLPDNEATLKRIYREPSGYRLEPANPTMKPIRVPSVEVRGAVIGVVRRY